MVLDCIAQIVPLLSRVGPPLWPLRPGEEVSTNSVGNGSGFAGSSVTNSHTRVKMPSIGNTGRGSAPSGRRNPPAAASHVGSMEWNGKPSLQRLTPGSKSFEGSLNTG